MTLSRASSANLAAARHVDPVGACDVDGLRLQLGVLRAAEQWAPSDLAALDRALWAMDIGARCQLIDVRQIGGAWRYAVVYSGAGDEWIWIPLRRLDDDEREPTG